MTNFTGCVPISKKNNFDLMVREILQFTQVLDHSECTYLCDSEPSMLQAQKRGVHARQMMGLVTHSKTPAVHGNSLCESVNRAWIDSVQEKLSIKLNTEGAGRCDTLALLYRLQLSIVPLPLSLCATNYFERESLLAESDCLRKDRGLGHACGFHWTVGHVDALH